MNINTNINMRGKMVPLKNYRGPVLKLTKADKKKIEAIQENINQYTHEIMQLQRKLDTLSICPLYDYIYEEKAKLEYQVDVAMSYIQKIKTERFNKQKAKFAKKNGSLDIEI